MFTIDLVAAFISTSATLYGVTDNPQGAKQWNIGALVFGLLMILVFPFQTQLGYFQLPYSGSIVSWGDAAGFFFLGVGVFAMIVSLLFEPLSSLSRNSSDYSPR